ncbi:MAG: protein-export membrane protein SecF [Candidatus Portnoybacteria bacterium RBG_19FT_COMBO_36_7]|uniref:Protein-export membrane protein SecF n=1 Tax=Candidatus Portnoybacteria bacterium RBG_19FT_COMBO_36_7 TaxID=1801992 RepID=A0A1G2F6Y0_9BACT|nr:MAG: protein-export membrane protein SecF [Candidatus Portnoybacteria bacterium RBG_19FT_COMBO_36_7]
MNINFVKYTKTYYIFSGILAAGAVLAIMVFGLNSGIDFLGGSILEVEFEQLPENRAIQEKLSDLNLGEIVIQPTEERGIILRTKEIDEVTYQTIILRLGEISPVKELRFESIGPVIGQELRKKTITLIVVSLIALLIYIAISFRKVSRPIASWQYGSVSIITLAFDVLITIGLFSVIGRFSNVQFSIAIITALLTILGYTINDKVVVFDRVRENLLRHAVADFDTLVNQSLNQTIIRTISTGTCSLLVLFAIFFFGGETLKYFSLALIVGIITGTFSSLFIASPLLVSWEKFRQRRLARGR